MNFIDNHPASFQQKKGVTEEDLVGLGDYDSRVDLHDHPHSQEKSTILQMTKGNGRSVDQKIAKIKVEGVVFLIIYNNFG